MSIQPSTARGRLCKRRAWLIARSEAFAAEGRPTYFLDEEIEMLDYFEGFLDAVSGPRGGSAAATEGERVQRARDTMAARQKRCNCGTCPVHGGESSGKVPQ